MRITFDFHENELKMSQFLTDRLAEVVQKMGPRTIEKNPRTGHYNIAIYQTTHTCGGAIMGADPKTSAVNRYLQSWDVPNLFVTRATVFPQNAGYNPTGLTNDLRTGLGSWSIDDIVSYLKTGHNRVSGASGPMEEVIGDSTSQMTDADLKAIAVYLKGEAARNNQPQNPVSAQDTTMRAGEAIYADNCSECHMETGVGVPNLFSALKGNPSVQVADPISLIRVVFAGTKSVATDRAPTAPAMPAFDRKLSDVQVAAVVTYIRNSWGNAASPVSEGQATSIRDQIAQDPP